MFNDVDVQKASVIVTEALETVIERLKQQYFQEFINAESVEDVDHIKAKVDALKDIESFLFRAVDSFPDNFQVFVNTYVGKLNEEVE